jgi:acyl-CoA reductase-like NAD-dependent aldehyde dehydrogenase
MATIEKPSATATIQVENPATGQVVRTLPVTSQDEVRALVDRARAAQPAWEALGFEGRGRVLRRMQKWMVDNAERVVQTIIDESGKTYEDASVVELAYGAGALGFWAKHAPKYLADEKVRTSNPFVLGRKLAVRYRPVGVVGVIGPWNYPLTNNFGDAVPALAAGNAVVLKPSQITPLTSLLLAEGIRECGLPADAIQVVIGGADQATTLIDGADFVMFTGSTATGKKVMARAAETLTPVGLELGGKDPMPTRTSSAPRTPPPTTRCRTAARPACPSSASTSRRRSTTSSSTL